MADLITQAHRPTKFSSPGVDGLSYPYLAILFQIPCIQHLVSTIYNDAMKGVLPPSWQNIRVRLSCKVTPQKRWLDLSEELAAYLPH